MADLVRTLVQFLALVLASPCLVALLFVLLVALTCPVLAGLFDVMPVIASLIDPITSLLTLPSATYANNTTGSVTLVATIPQGSSVNTRDGKSCPDFCVRVRGRIVADTATLLLKA